MAQDNSQSSSSARDTGNSERRNRLSLPESVSKSSQTSTEDSSIDITYSMVGPSNYGSLLVRELFLKHKSIFEEEYSVDEPRDELGKLSALWFSIGDEREIKDWYTSLVQKASLLQPAQQLTRPEIRSSDRSQEADRGGFSRAGPAISSPAPPAADTSAQGGTDPTLFLPHASEVPESAFAPTVAHWWALHERYAGDVLQWNTNGLPNLLAQRFVDAPRLRNAALPVVSALRSPGLDRRMFGARVLELLGLIRAAEGRGEHNGEDATDTLALPLSRIVDIAGDTKPAYQEFLRRLYGLLWRDATSRQATAGQLQSMAALGDVSGRIKEDRFLRQAVVIYEAVIRDLCEGLLADEQDKWTRSRIGANNISGFISTLARFDAGAGAARGDGLKLARLMNRMQCISTIGSSVSEDFPERAVDVNDWKLLDSEHVVLPAASESSDQTRFLLDASMMVRAMNNVISAWSYADPQIFPFAVPAGSENRNRPEATGGGNGESFGLVLTTIGAMVRARYSVATGEDLDEPSSALFNAALALGRLTRQQSSLSASESAAGQVTFNALGLFWALNQGRSLASALFELNGESCLVNMLGSATRLTDEMRPEPVERALGPVVALANGWLKNNLITGNERFRIEASLRELNERNRPDRPVKLDQVAAKELIENLWRQVIAALGIEPGQADLSKDFVGSALPKQIQLIRRVLDGDQSQRKASKFSEVSITLLNMLKRMMEIKQANDPLNTLAVYEKQTHEGEKRTEIRRVLEGLSEPAGADWKIDFELMDKERVKTEALALETSVPSEASLPKTYTELLDRKGALAWLPNVVINERLR
jgi:hypothetical protein